MDYNYRGSLQVSPLVKLQGLSRQIVSARRKMLELEVEYLLALIDHSKQRLTVGIHRDHAIELRRLITKTSTKITRRHKDMAKLKSYVNALGDPK